MKKTKHDLGRPWDLLLVGLVLQRAEDEGIKPTIPKKKRRRA